MSLVQKLKSFFVREQRAELTTVQRWVSRSWGETSDFSFETAEQIYMNNPEVYASVETLVSKTVGQGFYTSVDEDEKAKEIIDEFCEKVNLDEKLIEIARFLLIYGNCFVEKIRSENSKKIVDIKVWSPKNWRIKRNEYGEIIGYIQQAGTKKINFEPEEIIFFKWIRVGEKAFGLLPLQPLKELHETEKWLIENMDKIFKTYYAPRLIWYLPPKVIDEFVAKLRSIEPDEDIFVPGDQNTVKAQQIEVKPAQWKEYFDFLKRMKTEGLPAAPMNIRYNSTEASARVIDQIDNEKANLLQRYIKRKIEGELFKPIIEYYGRREVPRLNFGAPKSVLDDLELDDIIKLMDYDYDYAFKLLIKKGFPPKEDSGEVKEKFFREKLETDPFFHERKFLEELKKLVSRFQKGEFDRNEMIQKGKELLYDYVWRAYLSGHYRATRETGHIDWIIDETDMKIINNVLSQSFQDLKKILLDVPLKEQDIEQRMKAFVAFWIWRSFNLAKDYVFRKRNVWIQWDAKNDPKTCIQCWDLDGRVWRPDEPHPIPPLHPLCRCLLRVYKR